MIEIDEKIADEKINHPSNILNDPKIKIIGKGNHGNGSHLGGENLKLSTEMKALIGSMAKLNGHGGAKLISEAFGVNHSLVSRYQQGKVSAGNTTKIDPELKAQVDSRIDTVREQALDKLLAVMGVITPDKLDKLGATNAAEVGLKMASIHEKLGPKGIDPRTINQQVIIYAPRQKDEKDYLTVEVEPQRD